MHKFLDDKVFIVAELSANHNGSLDIAIETIKAAAKSGADAIKIQTYRPDTITINSSKKDFIINNGSIWDGQNYFELYKKAHTPWEWHPMLFEVAKQEGIICFSSPFDITAVEYLEKLGNPMYKIASFEIKDIQLIEYVASKSKPMIISTGIAKKKDIELALKTIRKKNKEKIILLKCTSSYPTPIEEANLIMIKDYQDKFDVIPGLSDHTLGTIAPIVATSLGARLIEKHFILDRSLGGPDSSFSLNQKEFQDMVKAVRDAEKSLGQVKYSLTKKQKEARKFSRSLYVVENVKKGEIATMKNIKSIRPGFGMHPKNLKNILGKKFIKNFSSGTRVSNNLFKNNDPIF